jgi:GH24 family phage-related lysozyme (muramidase)
MIPLLLAAGRAALAAGRVSSAVSAAKGVTSALKNRGYISKAGSAARQMARAGSTPRGTSSAFRNPYRFANNPGKQKAAGSDMESSVQEENTQTQSNTKKQTLIISADNVFLRTSQAIMQSAMPEAPQNIERASGSDEPTSISGDDKKTGGLGASAGIILGKLLYKVFDVIVQKIKDVFKQLQTFFLKSLSGIYRVLDSMTPGKFFKNKADAIDKQLAEESATGAIKSSSAPSASVTAPTATGASVSTITSPTMTPRDTTAPVALGSAGASSSSPAIVGSNLVRSLFTTKNTNKTSTTSISSLIKQEEGFSSKAYFDPPKDRQDAKNAERKKEGKTPLPYTYSIGYGHQITQDELAKGYINVGDEKIPVKGEGGKDTTLGATKEQAKINAGKLLDIDLPKYTARAKEPLGEEAWSKLTEKQQAALVSYSYNVGSTSNLVKKHGLKEAIMKGDTTTAGNIIAEKGIRTSSGKIDPGLVARRKKEGELFKEDSIQAAPSATMNIKPQSSAGSLSAPTQATGRNIEMTSQILNSAPSVTTAQNTQPVVINNINAPTVASGKGSSGPAIEMSVFRNIDNSILANTNRHLRAGILGV